MSQPKSKSETRPHSSPDPSCGRESAEAKRKSFSLENMLSALPRSNEVPPPARDLEGRTLKKNVPFLFQEKFHHHIREARNIFSLVLPSEARQWRNDSFHIGIFLEKVRILFRRHSQVSEFVFSPNAERRKATRRGFPPEFAKGF